MSRINFNHLYYFMVIAKKGSITQASQVLHLTQSTLSDQLRQFEDYLGQKLFDRKPRKLVLNRAGKIALDYASKVFNMADEMEEAIKQKKRKRIEQIRLGVIPSLPKSHAHEFVEPIWKKKGLSISIIEGGLDYLVKELERMNLDMILSDMPLKSVQHDLINRHLTSRTIVAVAHPKFERLKKNFPYSLDGMPFLHFTQHSQLRYDTDQFFKLHNITPDIVGEVDDVTLARLSVEKGVGFCLIPKKAVQDSIRQKKMVILGSPKAIQSDMWAITTRSAKTHPLLLKSVSLFKQQKTQ